MRHLYAASYDKEKLLRLLFFGELFLYWHIVLVRARATLNNLFHTKNVFNWCNILCLMLIGDLHVVCPMCMQSEHVSTGWSNFDARSCHDLLFDTFFYMCRILFMFIVAQSKSWTMHNGIIVQTLLQHGNVQVHVPCDCCTCTVSARSSCLSND
jgi:hypothetical protein